MTLFWYFVPVFFPYNLAHSDEIEVPPIVVEGTPGDILREDAIVPAISGETNLNSGTGSIQNSLQNQMALPITDSGKPGNLAQVRGFGFSAEDVDVQILGISVNPPQGGGFDLSVFPQFLWSGYRYQMGPALNALNPTASTGTLSLVPWTSTALNQPGLGGRTMGFSSSLGVNQVSAAARGSQNAAVVAGYSTGTVMGPSAGVSSRWKISNYTGSVHLLATDVDAQTLNSIDSPTLTARTHTTRVIPMLQNDFKLAKRILLKTSLFYDWGYLGYQDPAAESQYRSNSQQWGAENVCLVDQWKFGLSGRQVKFNSSATFGSYRAALDVPLQNVGNLEISREIDIGNVLVEPTFQGVWTTGYGFLPEGSLGVRNEFGKNAVFMRTNFSSRTPSLLDRYSVTQDFTGNPNLQTETDWTGILGGEIKGKKLESSLQTYAQLKQNARVYTGNSVNNLNDAYVLALTGSTTLHLSNHLDGFYSGTVSKSRLIVTGYEFPYIPNFLNIIGMNLHEPRENRSWEWTTVVRISSSQVSHAFTGDRLPGYLTLDTGAQLNIASGLRVAGRIEDVFDRSFQLIQGYPLGRTFSVMMMGEI